MFADITSGFSLMLSYEAAFPGAHIVHSSIDWTLNIYKESVEVFGNWKGPLLRIILHFRLECLCSGIDGLQIEPSLIDNEHIIADQIHIHALYLSNSLNEE